MRVSTEPSLSSAARTYPVAPFGRIGSWTRYQAWLQAPSTRAASTPKTVGKPLTFRGPNVASRRPPGRA